MYSFKYVVEPCVCLFVYRFEHQTMQQNPGFVQKPL